jgi:light-regulated signal transduction histidine kinase (bacteriophytochrome)
VAIAVVTVEVRVSLDHALSLESPFLLFYPAVLIAALYLGRGPGLLCLAICTAEVGIFIMPRAGWTHLEEPLDVTDLILFALLAGLLVTLVDGQRRLRASAEVSRQDALLHAVRMEREVADRQRAEMLLRQSNEDLEDFAHIVSHDLKEPLRGISTTAQHIMEDFGEVMGNEGRQRLETLVRLPRRMSTLLDALLEYSRVGRTEMAVVPTDVKKVVGDVCEGLRPWLEERNARVEVGDLPEAVCDKVRLGQVFSNLISNGVKYNETREPRVQVGARNEDGTPVYYVSDNGIGIEPKQAPRLFRMFSRLHGRERYGGGTGSGLALAKKNLERHGGRIWFESAPGKGTTFYFTLGQQRAPGRSAGAA